MVAVSLSFRRVCLGVGVSLLMWACLLCLRACLSLCGWVFTAAAVSLLLWACLLWCGRVYHGVGVSLLVWACLYRCGRVTANVSLLKRACLSQHVPLLRSHGNALVYTANAVAEINLLFAKY